MNRELLAWSDVVEHKESLTKDIKTLNQIKTLLE